MRRAIVPAALGVVLAMGGCAQAPEDAKPAATSGAPATRAATPAPTAAAADATGAVPASADTEATRAALPKVLVHKSPTCGCCTVWVEHMREAGFEVDVRNSDDLEPIKKRLGVPAGKGSCHTAEIGGLVVEGHVPAEDIKRLLADRGDARGLVLPGMPAGSPGMEMPDGRVQRYTVEKVNADGSTSPFATHGE